jgi:hypothetical protein
MNLIRVGLVLLIVCGITVPNSLAQDVDLPITSTQTAQMRFGDRPVPIHPLASNVKIPATQWQFRYKLLLVPEVDREGKLVVAKSGGGNQFKVSVRIWLDNPKARELARKAVMRGYPQNAQEIQDDAARALDISEMQFSASHPKGNWKSEPFNPGTAQSHTVSIPAKSGADADAIVDWLRVPDPTIRVQYKYGTRKITENSAFVMMKHLKGTNLYMKLDGLPKDDGKVYVHRDQLGNLCENIRGQIAEIDWVEDSATFDRAVVDGLIHQWSKQREIDFSNQNAWVNASFYNKEDLTPDKIQKDFTKGFTYNDVTKRYKLNVSGAAGGNIGLGPLSIGGSAQGSYAKDDLEHMLSSHGFEAEVDGMIIKPKKLFLQTVNTAEFNSTLNVANRRLFVGERRSVLEPVDVELHQALQDHAVQFDLVARVAELQSKVQKYEDLLKIDRANRLVQVSGSLNVKGQVGLDKGINVKGQVNLDVFD